MTDEEMAEKYAKGLCKTCKVDVCRHSTIQTCAIQESLKQAHLDGLKAGREIEKEYVRNNAFTSMKEQGLFPFGKWHKVADGDLPKNTRYVWTNVGPSYYDDDKDCPCWRDEFGRTQGVIAWCEPKFEE